MAVQPGGSPGDFVIPDALPVLPLREAIVFPLTAVPLSVGQPRSGGPAATGIAANDLLPLAPRQNPKGRPAPPPTPHRMGPAAVTHNPAGLPNGRCARM